MIDSLTFAKTSGSGNDFICIDNLDGQLAELISSPQRASHFARTLCRRGLGVGADGLIFACQPQIEGVSDIQAVFLEADGSEAELCGNGVACFTHWTLSRLSTPKPELKILTKAGVVRGKAVDGPYIRVCIPLPEDIRLRQRLELEGQQWEYDFAITGVPHLVTHVGDLEHLDIYRWGPAFRWHNQFQPRGVNANFVQVIGEGQIAVRTWEFGVEGETLACGTGCATAAILTAIRNGWSKRFTGGDEPVLARVASGDTLKIWFTLGDDNAITDVCLESIVRPIFEGTLSRHLLSAALGLKAL